MAALSELFSVQDRSPQRSDGIIPGVRIRDFSRSLTCLNMVSETLSLVRGLELRAKEERMSKTVWETVHIIDSNS